MGSRENCYFEELWESMLIDTDLEKFNASALIAQINNG